MSQHPVPSELHNRLKTAWSIDTSSRWTPANPALGQCSVTALAVQDMFGGEILKTPAPEGMHFYNRIAGARWDLTAGQFDQPVSYEDIPSNREEALADTSPAQYRTLRQRLGLGR